MTKTSASTEKEMRAELDRYRREMGTDYIDILLLHCMLDADWPERKKGAMAVISEAREKGIVRTHGTSCHTLEALKTAARTPWVQVDLARINPAGVAGGRRSTDRHFRGCGRHEGRRKGSSDEDSGPAARICRRMPAVRAEPGLRGLHDDRIGEPGGIGRPVKKILAASVRG